jgi:hypothetical protein
MSRKFVSLFAVVAMLAVPVVVSAQCSNCGTSAPVYSTPISGGVVYGQNVTYTGGMVYGNSAYVPAQSGCCSSTPVCGTCCPQPVSCCNSCNTQCCNQRTVTLRPRNNCCSTPRRGIFRGRSARSSYCNTGCNTCCASSCDGCVQQVSYNSGCNSCGQVSYAGGCVGCATTSSSGVIMGESAAPVEPQAAPVVASPSDVVTPPVPTEDK